MPIRIKMSDKNSHKDQVILVNKLTREYLSGDAVIRALDSVSFSITNKDYISIIGASGSGKSTLLNILGCLDRPDSGEYLLDGHPVSENNTRQLAKIRNQKIGYVFQNFNLLNNYTALQNVMLPLTYSGVEKEEKKIRAMESLKIVGLKKRMEHKPNQLSGGERQRVAVARALVNKPKIILADEPTGNLDTKSRNEILSIFEEVNQMGNTLIIVTHDQEIANKASRIFHIADGQLTES